jgi:hypothetical protein
MGAPRWVEGGPAATQPLGGLTGVVSGQEPLELLGVKSPHGQPVALVDRCAQLLQVLVLVAVAVGRLVAHVLLPSANYRPSRS